MSSYHVGVPRLAWFPITSQHSCNKPSPWFLG